MNNIFNTHRAGCCISGPYISVLVRTCGRPQILRETLQSLRRQTYKNFEVVIVEDGPNISEDMIKSEFGDLNTNYYSTRVKVGRSHVGNIAMESASGEYLNFLDDDDIFFPDHIETLINEANENPGYNVLYSLAYECPTQVLSLVPYKYKEKRRVCVYQQPFNRLVLFHHNYFPIQAVMFRKSVFERVGGFDGNLDALEDWDFWLRCSMDNDFKYVPKITSLYRVPFKRGEVIKRRKYFDQVRQDVLNRHKNTMLSISVFDLQNDYDAALKSNLFAVSQELLKKLYISNPLLARTISLIICGIKKSFKIILKR